MTKCYQLDEQGRVHTEPYQNAFQFDSLPVAIHNVRTLGDLIARNSAHPNICLIRGLHTSGPQQRTRRLERLFPEHPLGTPWVMLDIDGIVLPFGLSTISTDGVRWLIDNKLPVEFRAATCYFQFSSSSGICNQEGSLLKQGLRVHLFYFFRRRVPGTQLAGYLQKFCLDTAFYSLQTNRGGVVEIKYGIDFAPIKTASQPHYIAHPIIAHGVKCQLSPDDRQGFIAAESDFVELPEIPLDASDFANRRHRQLRIDWQQEHGYERATVRSTSPVGLSAMTYYRPPRNINQVQTGRPFSRGEITQHDTVLLFFEDENTPGSWFVAKHSPQVARRFGDFETLALRELSEGAYTYVRDELAWFEEIPHQGLSLTEAGFVPAFHTFAQARFSLILAPTGSGKTASVVHWMTDKARAALVIYVAQTIPLVNQMREDLLSRQVSCLYYAGFDYRSLPRAGIFLTTNKSLPKILRALNSSPFGARIGYHVVVDEIHLALDDFARSVSKLQMFREALSGSRSVLFMTGTLTETQRLMLPDQVSQVCGRRLTASNYCCYEFGSVKRNPLQIHPLASFKSDFVLLLQTYRGMVDAGVPLPRTMLLLPTSRMEKFRQLVDQYQLSDHAIIVSRQESPDDEIELARVGNQSLLITSPLFSVGLNLQVELEVLWCSFEHIKADASRVVQTINRANRGEISCEVRIYAGSRDDRPYAFPNRPRLEAEIVDAMAHETSFTHNGFDLPLMLDCLTYAEYRKAEHDTNKAITRLIRENSFQNYVIANPVITTRCGTHETTRRSIFNHAANTAREVYDQRVMERFEAIGAADPTIQFWRLRILSIERQEAWRREEARVQREIEEDTLAIIMRIRTGITPGQARKISVHKLSVLFGDRVPWLSDQISAADQSYWARAAAEKTRSIIPLVEQLRRLFEGISSEIIIAKRLNQHKALQSAFLALVENNGQFLQLTRDFARLAELCRARRNSNTRANLHAVNEFALRLTQMLLEPLGIFFSVAEVSNQIATQRFAPNWDYFAMVARLEKRAALIEALPTYCRSVHQDLEPSREQAEQSSTSVLICETCRLFMDGCCACGRPIDWSAWGIESGAESTESSSTCMNYVRERGLM